MSHTVCDKLSEAMSKATDTRTLILRDMTIPRRKLDRALVLGRHAPDLADRVLAGDLDLIEACQSLRGRQREEAAQIANAPSSGDNYHLICADSLGMTYTGLGEHSEFSAPYDAIITDPPYKDSFLLNNCGGLAAVAAQTLQYGGSLIVFVGQLDLPVILHTMSALLEYHWLVSYEKPGGPLYGFKVNTYWKAVAWFTHGKYEGGWADDLVKSQRVAKRFHQWEENEAGMAQLIEQFTRPGDTVLDPFCGSGTTGVAALKLGRRFVGVDIDEQAVKVAAARLSSVTSAV